MKTCLKKSIGQEKLTHLALLNIESKTSIEKDFYNFIKYFALTKTKNVNILCSDFWLYFE